MRKLVLLGILAASPLAAREPKEERGGDNFLVFPVTTELQRLVLFDDHTRVYVLVNGDAVLPRGQGLQPKVLNLQSLENKVRRLDRAARSSKNDPEAKLEIIVTFHRDRPFPEDDWQLLRYALYGAGRGVVFGGFKDVQVVAAIQPDDQWKFAVDLVKQTGAPENDHRLEDRVADPLVRVYPVRTALSRFRLDDADCLVQIGERRAAAPSARIVREQEKTVAEKVDRLELPRKKRVAFWYGQRPGGKAWDELEQATEELAKKLNFEKCSIHSY